ncbi:MAG: peptide chain release factor N(5)-glutamine methyltransferase [Anaerolineae bacterium]|nr:peptide chain release factor N(5)-glutamine methyltransferase [Anaerolineales bacterium]MCQ3976321.1 peptide chain release factor N(5)-glutamine methyltransferase [Anaerolineae bacterium]
MTSLGDILEKAIHRLSAVGCDTPRLDAEVLLAHSLGRERTWLYLHVSDSLDENQTNKFEALLHRREQREPVAYIVGYKEFFGLEFEVYSAVLIPRPETELLVETALEIYDLRFTIYDFNTTSDSSQFTIADVGTGSGCIAIALAKHLPSVSIFALETSPAALSLARRNAEKHGVAASITFLSGDLLAGLTEPADLIVSNPPYVSRSELAAAMPEVSRYEPRLALDGGEDGLDVIRLLLPQAREKLKPGGALLVEIGSTQGPAVRQLAQFHFPGAAVEVKKDLAGLDRLLVVKT